MKKRTILMALVVVTGCAAAPAMWEVAPGTLFEVTGANVYSPAGSDWYVMSSPYYGVQFAREYGGEKESLVAMTTIHKVEGFEDDMDFLQHVAEQRVEQDDRSRFRILNIDNEYVTYKSTACLNYKWLSEDHKDFGIESDRFQYLKLMGYICRHPDNPEIAFQMDVSFRGGDQLMPSEVRKLGEDFFEEIEFNSRGLADL